MTEPPTIAASVLSLQGLTKNFGRHPAVQDLSFDVHREDIFGFLGPNGAGKSTTMAMITGLVRPTSGSVRIFDQPVSDGPSARRHLGALVETPAFYEYMSARKNLEVLALANGGVDKRRIAEVLERVGLSARAHSAVREYSHGMKQRLGIAQALLHRPRLLLLDEPTNGLDPDGSAKVWEILRSLVRDEQMTVLVSSHLLHEVEENCNRIAVINQGILVACDSVKNLLFFNKEDHLLIFDSTVARDAAAQWLAGRAGVELLPGSEVDGAAAPPDMNAAITVRLRQGMAGDIVGGLASAGSPPRAVIPQRKNLKQFFLELTRRQQR